MHVRIARYDIETLAAAIADSLLGAGKCAGCPGLRLARVLVEGRFLKHSIEDFLEGALGRRWVLADMISWILREDARLHRLSVSCQLCFTVQSKLESTLGGAYWDCTLNWGEFNAFASHGTHSVSSVLVNRGLLLDKVTPVGRRVDPCVGRLGSHEALVRLIAVYS